MAAIAGAGAPAGCELWSVNLPAYELFVACAGQWRIIAHMRGVHYTGLDYSAVNVAALALHGGLTREMMLDLVEMERAALRVLNG